jgi:hypothetical protein
MTGAELKAARERLGGTEEAFAEELAITVAELRAAERSGIPKPLRRRVDLALWYLERDAALAQSGLAECEAAASISSIGELPEEDQERMAADWYAHFTGCPLCQAREQYVKVHCRPVPSLSENVVMRLWDRGNQLDGPWRDVMRWSVTFAGPVLVLTLGMSGAALLMGRFSMALLTVGLWLSLAAGGAVGGASFHALASLRERGTPGDYLGWILGAEAGAVVTGLLVLALCWIAGGEAEPIAKFLLLPAGWGVVLALGAGFGFSFAWEKRKGYLGLPRPAPASGADALPSSEPQAG